MTMCVAAMAPDRRSIFSASTAIEIIIQSLNPMGIDVVGSRLDFGQITIKFWSSTTAALAVEIMSNFGCNSVGADGVKVTGTDGEVMALCVHMGCTGADAQKIILVYICIDER